MSEVVGEGVIHIRTDSAGVDVAGEGSRAGGAYTKGFLGSLKKLAIGIGAVIAAREVVGFAKDAIAEGREAQKVGAATEQIIKSTGGTANVTAGQVSELASALSLKVGVDDEAIQSGANLLLTFKNVRNEAGKGNDVFDRTVASTQDLAAAGFGSIESASKGLGKALNDPLKGITALGRAGVTFTEAQKEQIAALVESGDLLSAQKIILGEVESQVGGVAEATATSGEKARVAWGNVQEAVGTLLLPVLDRLATFFTNRIVPGLFDVVDAAKGLGPVFSRVGDFIMSAFHAAAPIVQQFAGQLQSALAVAIPIVVGLVGDLVTSFQNLLPVVQPLAEQLYGIFQQALPPILAVAAAIGSNLGPVLVAVTGFLSEHADAVQAVLVGIGAMIVAYQTYQVAMSVVRIATTAFTAVQAALNVVLSANPIGLIVLALVGLVAGLIYAYKHSETFRNIVDKVGAAIRDGLLAAFRAVSGFITGTVIPIITRVIGFYAAFYGAIFRTIGAVASFASSLRNMVQNGIEAVVKAVASLPGRILDLGGKLLNAGKTIIGKFLDGLGQVGSFASGIADAVWGAVKGVINAAIDRLNNLLEFSISVGPKTFSVNPPDIGHLATGTSNWRGGLAVVGEQGPELVNLPRGAQVFTNRESNALATAAGARATINVHLPTGDPEAAGMAVMNRLVSVGFVGV